MTNLSLNRIKRDDQSNEGERVPAGRDEFNNCVDENFDDLVEDISLMDAPVRPSRGNIPSHLHQSQSETIDTGWNPRYLIIANIFLLLAGAAAVAGMILGIEKTLQGGANGIKRNNITSVTPNASDSVQSVEKFGNPVFNVIPENPNKLGFPGRPDDQGFSTFTGGSSGYYGPDDPGLQSDLIFPGGAGIPAAPGVPGAPNLPGAPGVPIISGMTGTQNFPGDTDISGAPGFPNSFAFSGNAGFPDDLGFSEIPGDPGFADVSGDSIHFGFSVPGDPDGSSFPVAAGGMGSDPDVYGSLGGLGFPGSSGSGFSDVQGGVDFQLPGSFMDGSAGNGLGQYSFPDPSLMASTRYKEIYKRVMPLSGSQNLQENSNTPQQRALAYLADADPRQVATDSDEIVPRYVLTALYYAFNGDSWTAKSNWLSANHVCGWERIECQFVGGLQLVTGVKMAKNNLAGSIPPELGHLTSLEELNLHSNKIAGKIPESIGALRSLRNLYLQNNSLFGIIPPQIGNMRNLRNLLLSNNKLAGQIPKEIGKLIFLEELHLYRNQMYGNLPSDVGFLINLRRLWLSKNMLSGFVPTEIANMRSLQALYLDENQFNGRLQLTSGNANVLEDIRLYGNSFTGEIPSDFKMLQKLKILYLDANFLHGSIPVWIGQLSNLEHLDLSTNKLGGNLPAGLGNLRKLKRLQLESNDFTGSIPEQLGNLSQLKSLRLSNNRLQGSVPTFFSLLSGLGELKLEGNQLLGRVPNALCSMHIEEFVVDCSVYCRCCPACNPSSQVRKVGNGFR